MIDTAPLIAEITAAFDGVSREGGIALSEGAVIDDYGCDEERAEARLLDTDTRWQDVTDDDITQHWASLEFTDAIGFRYYIPAWMIKDLRGYNAQYGISSDAVSYLRTPSNAHTKEIYRLLTPPQCKAIYHFVEFIANYGHKDYDGKKAATYLEGYWNRYGEGEEAKLLDHFWNQYRAPDTE